MRLPILAAAAVALFYIGRVFVAPACLAFDAADDANHTFVNLKAARAELAAGELPWINLYNNFGTPLIGDALTYPFAPQALTYALIDSEGVAMTVNRAVIVFLTVLALYAYFAGWMGSKVATACAVLAFSTPGFFWHAAHHHYQLALLAFAVQLLLHRQLGRRAWAFPLLCLASAVTFLSTNLGVSVLLLAFALAHQFLITGRRFDRAFWLASAAVVAGLLATWPETGAFLHNIAQALRLGYIYAQQVPAAAAQTLAGWVIQPHLESGGHLGQVLHIPLGISVLAAAGIVLRRRARAPEVFAWLLLGVLPAVFVVVLVSVPSIWARLPLLHAMDVSRILWFSMVMLLVPFGIGVESLLHARVPPALSRTLAVVAGIALLAALLAFRWPGMSRTSALLGGVFVVGIAWTGASWKPRVGAAVAASAALLGFVPFTVRTLEYTSKECDGTHYFAPVEAQHFWPPGVLTLLQPGSRFAMDMADENYFATELKGIYGGILGSSARSVIVDRRFALALEARGLTEAPEAPPAYHFLPGPPEALATLGIRYFTTMANAGTLSSTGWIPRGEVEEFHIFENPRPSPLVHFRDDPQPVAVDLAGNSLRIHVPPLTRPHTLIATFAYRDGWHANADGHTRAVATSDDDRLIHVAVEPGDRELTVFYQPYTNWAVVAWFAAGVVFAAGAFFVRLPRARRL